MKISAKFNRIEKILGTHSFPQITKVNGLVEQPFTVIQAKRKKLNMQKVGSTNIQSILTFIEYATNDTS